MAQVALPWSLSKDLVTAPIVGTTQPENLIYLAAGVSLKLTFEEVQYIDEPNLPLPINGR
ncbi:hypothetical protein FRC02_007396 [Tulasnella sp. 418]|nr:hypothetical protein FRC02_007396 [Tulasnella sp. 418]